MAGVMPRSGWARMARPFNILVTGGAGQIGLELAKTSWPAEVRLQMPKRDQLDLADARSVGAMFEGQRFDAVINSAAYTAVDRAEEEVAAAFAANALGPALLADHTRKAGIPLIQLSTDYVFDGRTDRSYRETDPVAPLGVYGASKLAGELAVRTGNSRSLVLRTAWVLSPHGGNFLKTMLRVGVTQPTVRVVDDQFGCPTSAADIATTLVTLTLRMIDDPQAPTGVYHFVNQGETSWCGLAEEIFRVSGALGGPAPKVEGIPTSAYPTKARRPARSSLATTKLAADFGVSPREWTTALADIIPLVLGKEATQ